MCVCVCLCVCMYVCVFVCVCMYVYVCVYVCITILTMMYCFLHSHNQVDLTYHQRLVIFLVRCVMPRHRATILVLLPVRAVR